MFSNETKIRVRYGKTDQMGFMYYGNYALYYEVGRVEAIRDLGITYKGLEDLPRIATHPVFRECYRQNQDLW